MKLLALALFLVAAVNICVAYHIPACCDRDVTDEALLSLYQFQLRLYEFLATQYKDHFIVAHYSIWLTLAAMAEGAVGKPQQQLFDVLGLPQEECLRQKFYQLLHELESSGDDAKFIRRRSIVVDDTVRFNEIWVKNVLSAGLLNNTEHFPITSEPQVASQRMAQLLGSHYPILDIDFSGNSVLLGSLNFEGLWTTAFPESGIEQNAKFYNEFGVHVGNVDLLHMTTRAKFAFLPSWNLKVLALPVGVDSRFQIMFFLNTGPEPIQQTIEKFSDSFIRELTENLKESKIPLEIAIPRLHMRSQQDNLRQVLEAIGVTSLWRDPESSVLVSTPPALPSAYAHYVSFKLDAAGVNPYIAPELTESAASQLETGLVAAFGRDFICNRPFLFGLFESQTNVILFGGAFSRPNAQIF